MEAADIGRKIEYFLKERNMSPYRLGKKIKMSMSTVYPYLRGERKPSIDSLEKICGGLEITLSQFFDEPGHQKYNLVGKEEVTIANLRSLGESFRDRALGYIQALVDLEEE